MAYTDYKEVYRVMDDEYCTTVENKIETTTGERVEVEDPVTGEIKEGYLSTEQEFTVTLDIFKAKDDNDQHLVSGWANIAINADGSRPLDWQGDIIEPAELEKAAIEFMMDYRESGVNHQGDAKGVVVESVVMTKDKQAAMGIPEGTVPEGWFITVKVLDDEVFQKVKSGEYRMFSIQGTAERVAV